MRNPGVTCLWTTKSYRVVQAPNGGALFQLGDPEKVEYFAEGLRCDPLMKIPGLDGERAAAVDGSCQGRRRRRRRCVEQDVRPRTAAGAGADGEASHESIA